ncbi:hypothetical protein [Ramlibacter sp.]|uniref:hypothetical protein n=1 Tax=Ramlibacter sp. TaxID=1917967 RepID=UPI0035B3DB80
MKPAGLRRRDWLLAASALTAGVPAARAAQGRVTLAKPDSLADALAGALAARLPLVVMASLDGCAFCMEARDAYLGPLRDETGQPVVQVDLRSNRAIRDYDGQPTTHDALTRAWKIVIAPTVLFVGPGGREIAPRLAGASLPDFYGAYLEDRVRRATRVVRG